MVYMMEPLKLPPYFQTPNYTDLRRGKLQMFFQCLQQHDAFAAATREEQIKVIKLIERSCLAVAIRKAHEKEVRNVWGNAQFKSLYHAACYKISSNIDPELSEGARQFVRKIMLRELAVEKLSMIGGMNSQAMFPELYQDINKRIANRGAAKTKAKGSKLHRCPRCHSRDSCVTSKQTRSLDEGASFEATCQVCSHMWRVG